MQRPPSCSALAACPPVCHRTLQAHALTDCRKRRPPPAILSPPPPPCPPALICPDLPAWLSLTSHTPCPIPSHPILPSLPPTLNRAAHAPHRGLSLVRSARPAARKGTCTQRCFPPSPHHLACPSVSRLALSDVDIARPPTGCSRQPLARQPPTSSASILSFAAVPHSKIASVPFVLHPI